MDDNLSEEGWDIRETYAYFGRAFYMASVLEVGLAHALMFGEFMIQARDKYVANRGKGFDRKQYEADFDAYMNDQFAQTMGNIIRRVETLPYFSGDLRSRIGEAKKRRDFLTHHYWREESVTFATAEGRAKMRDNLSEDAEMFERLDKDIEAAMKLAREKLGIDDKALEEHVRGVMEKVKSGSPWED